MKGKFTLNLESAISLVFVLTLSTICFFSITYVAIPNHIIELVLFYFCFFGYGFVLLIIIFHYLSKVNIWLGKDNMRIIVTISIILALSHSIFIGLDNRSWYSFAGYMTGDLLIILIGTLAYNRSEKNKTTRKK